MKHISELPKYTKLKQETQMEQWTHDLSGHPKLFENIHFQYQTWKLVLQISQQVTQAVSSFSQKDQETLLSFWEASIVEFHLYYALPILSATACEERELKTISSLNRNSISTNGLKIEGMNENRSRFHRFFFFYPLILFILRAGYGVRQTFRLKLPHKKKALFAAWISTPSSFEVFKKILKPAQQDETVFLSHALKESPIEPISEGSTSFHSLLLLRWLRKISFKAIQFQCPEHGVTIEPTALSQLWLSFVASRWPAYWSFKTTAIRVTGELKHQGVKAFLIHHERNLRERVWCQEFKKRGITSVVIQKGLIGVDALWTYRRLADRFWVDSPFTCRVLEQLGSGGIFLPLGYSALPETLPTVDLPPKLSRHKKILFYATQDVSELGPGMKNKVNPASASIKEREMRFLLTMARKYDFQILIKPHPAEYPGFYVSLTTPDDPVHILDSRDSSFDYLKMSSSVVTRWSTVGYEAMAYGIPVFYLNFYHRFPDIACFHEPWIAHARNETEAASLFHFFWSNQELPVFREKYRHWAASQGWHFGVPETLSKSLHLLTASSAIDTSHP